MLVRQNTFANNFSKICLQLNQLKSMKKVQKLISDNNEKAYWRIYRPPPGFFTALEQVPVPTRCWNGMRVRKKTIDDYRREVSALGCLISDIFAIFKLLL